MIEQNVEQVQTHRAGLRARSTAATMDGPKKESLVRVTSSDEAHMSSSTAFPSPGLMNTEPSAEVCVCYESYD